MRKRWTRLLVFALVLILLVSCAKPIDRMTATELLQAGENHLLDSDYEQAVLCFERLIQQEPKNQRGYTGLAEAYVGLDMQEKAMHILREGLVQLPDDPEITSMRDKLLSADVSDSGETTTSAGHGQSSKDNYDVQMIEQPTGAINLTLDKVKVVFEALGYGIVTDYTDETVAASVKSRNNPNTVTLFLAFLEYTSPTGISYDMLYYPLGLNPPEPYQDMHAFDSFWLSINKTPDDLGTLDNLQVYQGSEYEMGVYVDDVANTVFIKLCSGYYSMGIYGTLDNLAEISKVIQMLSET